MNIAELFIEIGVKGEGAAKKALVNVQTNLQNITSSSLEAKAAIIGALYALQRLTSASAQEGTALKNFSLLTGLNTKQLQQWQYAARQAGASNEELNSSVASVQQKMAAMLRGEGAPKGFEWLSKSVDLRGVDFRDTFKVMEKLQEFIQKNKNAPDLIKDVISSFGVSDNVAAGMYRNIFNPKTFKQAPFYNDKQIGSLDAINRQWNNLFDKVQRFIGVLNAKHGNQLIKDITMLADKVFIMADAFLRLTENLKVFEKLSMVFQGWGLIFDQINNLTSGKSNFKEDMKDATRGFLDSVLPSFAPPAMAGNTAYTVNQTNNFTNADQAPKKIHDSTKQAVEAAGASFQKGRVQ